MKSTSYSEVKNLMIVITFNHPTTVLENGVTVNKYQPVVVEVRTDALTVEGACRGVIGRQNIGNPTINPLTLKQIYTQVNKTTVGGILAGVLKTAVQEAIADDVSV